MSGLRRLWRIGYLLMAAWFGLQSLPTLAAGADVSAPTLIQTDDGPLLNSQFTLNLSPALTDAVNHGIPLVFQLEAEIRRPRWYWVDDTLYKARIDRRLTYNALVRNYRVTEDQGARNFLDLTDALNYIARPAVWRIPAGLVRPGEVIDVAIRFRLDPAFLPKPFQVVSFGDRDWRLDSEWRQFQLTVPTVAGGK